MVSVMQKLKNRGCIIVKDLVTNRRLKALKSQRTLLRTCSSFSTSHNKKKCKKMGSMFNELLPAPVLSARAWTDLIPSQAVVGSTH